MVVTGLTIDYPFCAFHGSLLSSGQSPNPLPDLGNPFYWVLLMFPASSCGALLHELRAPALPNHMQCSTFIIIYLFVCLFVLQLQSIPSARNLLPSLFCLIPTHPFKSPPLGSLLQSLMSSAPLLFVSIICLYLIS